LRGFRGKIYSGEIKMFGKKPKNKTINREHLLRGYAAAQVWFYGVVKTEFAVQTFNINENEPTTVKELCAAAEKFSSKNEVFTRRREFFVSTYAFDGWSYSDICKYAEKAERFSRQEYDRSEIYKYTEIGYIPTTPQRDRLGKFLDEFSSKNGAVILNRIEKEMRLGNRTDDVLENLVKASAVPGEKQNECKLLILEMARFCPNWSIGGTFNRVDEEDEKKR
jgi:hypothetical protein